MSIMMTCGRRFSLTTVVYGIIFTVSTSIADKDLISNGPIISPSLSEIILHNGQNYTLNCKGNVPIHFTQQHIPEEVVSNYSIRQENKFPTDPEYKYEIELHLSFVDRYAIGYFACTDDTFNVSIQLSNLTEEPENTEHAAYIYIYVNGTGSLFAPMREFIIPRGLTKVVIECRPTTPDVEVNLTEMVSQSNKTADIRILKNSTKIGFLVRNDSRATYVCHGRRSGFPDEWKNNIRQLKIPPVPKITSASKRFLEGESFSLNCTVPFDNTNVAYLDWTYPTDAPRDTITVGNEELLKNNKISNKMITVHNATKQHAGDYICKSKNSVDERASRYTKILVKPTLSLKKYSDIPMYVDEGAIATINCIINAYPPIKFYFLKDNKPLREDKSKYKTYQKFGLDDAVLQIYNSTITDTATYTLVVSNGFPDLEQTASFQLFVRAKPIVTFGGTGDKTYMENTITDLQCDVMAYPPPTISWIFSNGEEQVMNSTIIERDPLKVYSVRSLLRVPVQASGNITCKAVNFKGNSSVTRRLLIYEIYGGFGIKNKNQTWYSENDEVVLKCLASKYYFVNLTWFGSDDEELVETTIYKESPFSHVAELRIPHISLNQSGLNYTCLGSMLNGTIVVESLTLTIAPLQTIAILEPIHDIKEKVLLFQSLSMSCIAEGVPPPIIQWYKDDDLEIYENKTNGVKIFTNIQNHSYINSTIYIDRLQKENLGIYTCSTQSAEQRKTFTLALASIEPQAKAFPPYLIAIIVIILVLIILVAYLTCKVRKDKQFRKELDAAGLLYFKKGVTGSLNPDLGIDEQAELLPYDEKFEFPPEKLTLGIQLGSGAFGVVYKAEARGIINAEETTTVAVKMVKKTADNMYIKALASELKIMIHMGKHMNIVNLLGACTKNVGKRELVVIVEYCQFGNIHNYMQKHREVFIDQLTDNKEKNLGNVNRGFTTSSGSTGANSDYFGCNNTQDTDHTFLNTANTNQSGRKVSEGYVQPQWRSNYEADYSFDGRNPRPLSSRDLLCWSFQIARGMEYLASRKVLHGDLAARNILLADDNIVKICDFGLAKSIYKNDEYEKKENSPLPIKWLAIECMTDRIFSTQSDVWSFGIVLWEIFTLAKTPYPNISPSCLLQRLSEGHRLEKPNYADDRLYDVMKKCWEQKPTLRPSFSQLQELLGTFLEDNVRNHYVDLNATYMALNAKSAGQEDYLDMVCAPDYKNLVTPSPHHYVNGTGNFFPVTPTTQIDEEGYLQMSPKCNDTIFSPREQGTTFDFNPPRYNGRVSEASSCGSELTPMLTLNNLAPRSGSESDHEGNASPYLKMYPRIEEDPDEVFEMTQNNTKNLQNTVTNPTYITLNTEPEKKPKDIINNYINVPNGLVN